MIRTRDLFLFLAIAVFLVVAIGTTLTSRDAEESSVGTLAFNTAELPAVEVASSGEIDREVRRSIIRDKIAAGAELYIQTEFYEADEVATEEEVQAGPLLCANYEVYTTPWNAQTVTVETVEGAIVVAEEKQQLGATTTQQTVLLTIPMRVSSTGSQNCLQNDVVGVSLSGSLVRNSDALLYSGFSPSTLIGFALDGVSIYGPTDAITDQCGGAVTGGQYRYHVDPLKGVVVGCFAAAPASL